MTSQIKNQEASNKLDTKSYFIVSACLFIFGVLFVSFADKQASYLSIHLFAHQNINHILSAFISSLGDALVSGLVLVVFLYFYPQKAFRALLAVIFISLFVMVLKHSLDVGRPPSVFENGKDIFVIGAELNKYSFPSGHTATIFALASVLFSAVSCFKYRAIILLFASIVGISRVFVGVHWVEDVIFGAFFGWSIAWVSMAIFIRIFSKFEDKSKIGLFVVSLLLAIGAIQKIYKNKFDFESMEYWYLFAYSLLILFAVFLYSNLGIKVFKLLLNNKYDGSFKKLFVGIFKYGSVGVFSMAIDVAVYFLLVFVGVEHRVSRFFSYWIANINGWFWNRKITFAKANKENPKSELSRYLIMAVGSFLINYGIYFIATTYIEFFTSHKEIALFLGMGLAFLYNFLMANFFVFRGESNGNNK
jgi:membrane-associated phospholipid phosphatase/putative flippase GtrA